MAQITTTLPAGFAGRDNVPSPSDQIEQALTGSGIGMWDWDLVSGKASYSPLNNRMLGYDAGELGETFAEQAAKIHPDDARAMQAKVDQHLRGETASYRTEFRVLRKDGTYAWFESRGMVVEHGPNGEPWRMIGTHIDISDRKANEQLRRDLEAALRRNRDELEAMVRQQTQKLVDAADAAELGHRAKNALLANLGERVSSTTGRRNGYQCPAARRGTAARFRRACASHWIGSSGPRASCPTSCSVSSTSAASRPTPSTCTRPRSTCAASSRSSARRSENQALERGVDLRTVICDEDLVVFADRARLAQVVRELLNNAIKFTKHGLHTGAHEDVRRHRADRGTGHRRGHPA